VRVADSFDPVAIVRTLSERRVAFVVIGRMAEVANGSPLGFDDVEITYALKPDNLERLGMALGLLADAPPAWDELSGQNGTVVETRYGLLRLTPVPAGTRGWDDVRRKAHREHIARGLRVEVADVRDLIRIENAGDADRVRAATLQRIELHLSRSLGIDL
jgi:hypothetical protein